MSAILQNIDWKKISPEYSAELWMAHMDGKCANLKKAKQHAGMVTRELDKHFNGWNTPKSFDEPTTNGSSTYLEVLSIDDLEPSWMLSEQEEDEENTLDTMLGRLSQSGIEMIGLLGNSFATLFEKGNKKGKSGSHKAFNKLLSRVEKAVKSGASDDEISAIIETRLGRYFPQVVKKYELIEAQKKALKYKVPARVNRKWEQLDLFETV